MSRFHASAHGHSPARGHPTGPSPRTASGWAWCSPRTSFRLLDAITGAEILPATPSAKTSYRVRSDRSALSSTPTGRPFRIAEVASGTAPVLADSRPGGRGPANSTSRRRRQHLPLHHAIAVYQFGETMRVRCACALRTRAIPPATSRRVRLPLLTTDHRVPSSASSPPADTWYSLCDLATESVAVKLAPPDWEKRTDTARLAFAADRNARRRGHAAQPVGVRPAAASPRHAPSDVRAGRGAVGRRAGDATTTAAGGSAVRGAAVRAKNRHVRSGRRVASNCAI